MRILIVILIGLMTNHLFAQEFIPVGDWRSHFNYEQTYLVEQVNQKVFATTPNSLLIYDSEANALRGLSRLDGLTDVGVTAIAFDETAQRLVIGYENGNLDLIEGSDIHNNPVLLKSGIVDDKRIEDISFYEGTINLSTEFGVLVIDAQTDEVKASYRNLGANGEKIAVRNSTFLSGFMYLATERGVLKGDRASGVNLQDFNNWERFQGTIVNGRDIQSVAVFDQTVYAATQGTLMYLQGEDWIALPDFLNVSEAIHQVRLRSGGLLILTSGSTYILEENDAISELPIPAPYHPNDMIELNADEFFLADAQNGLVELSSGTAQLHVLAGPQIDVVDVAYESGVVFGFSQLDENISTQVSNGLGVSRFVDGQWDNLTSTDLSDFDNVSDVAIEDEKQYFSSFGQGVIETTSDVVFDDTNSTLRTNSGGNVLVGGVDIDDSGNLWVSNFSQYPLHRMDSEGNWERYAIGNSNTQEPTTLQVHPNGSIWMTLGLNTGAGILAYDPEEDRSRHISSTNTSLGSNTVNDIAFDMEGEIWFATGEGVYYFPDSFGVIEDQNADVVRPVFDDAYLFNEKKVNCIEVDAGNRKWMGTAEGLWLFEDNGNALVHQFDMSNSPLPSNNILDLAIHPKTGEVFVSTDKGLMSFRSDATSGGIAHKNVKIFPNPVLPEFSGLVGFDGLARDATLKITTVSGRLVREIKGAGSGASWNVADYNGRRVNAGVYLVFSANEDGSETYVGKIAVID